jgi:hypothetical protein
MDQPHNTIAAEATKHRGLLAVVIGLGVLIIIAVGVLVGGLLMGGREQGAGPRGREAFDVNLGLAPGAQLTSATLDGNRLLIQAERTDGGPILVILDVASGRIIGRVALQP